MFVTLARSYICKSSLITPSHPPYIMESIRYNPWHLVGNVLHHNHLQIHKNKSEFDVIFDVLSVSNKGQQCPIVSNPQFVKNLPFYTPRMKKKPTKGSWKTSTTSKHSKFEFWQTGCLVRGSGTQSVHLQPRTIIASAYKY